MTELLKHIKPLEVYIFITFFIAVYKTDYKKKDHRLLLYILIIAVLTEIISLILLGFNKPLNLSYNISFLLNDILWIYLLTYNFLSKKAVIGLIMAFFTIGVLNLLFYEGYNELNNYTFIAGAFIYIIFFVIKSFRELKKDNLHFFSSNRYILLFAPILFFLGLSFVLGFKSKALRSTIVFNDIKLYDLIVNFVNIIYYTLINVYIYKENKLKNGQ